jgi:hypothetical protein
VNPGALEGEASPDPIVASVVLLTVKVNQCLINDVNEIKETERDYDIVNNTT